MTTTAIQIDHVVKRFARPLPRLRRLLGRKGPDVIEALRGVSFDVNKGEAFGLVGRNGQGKTTLIKSTCGLIEPSEGSVRVHGFDSVRDILEVKRRVGLVSADERSFYFRLTGEQNLLFFGRLLGMSDAATKMRMHSLVTELELDDVISRPFQEYSSGNKQRLSIARALLCDAPVLLLDEPTRSLDPISAQALRATIRRWVARDPSRTVLITTHNLAEIEALCERVAILSRGKVIECAPLEELRQKYTSEEKVTLRVRGTLSEPFISAQKAQFPNLEISSEGLIHTLVLVRRVEDDKLHRLITRCVESGLEISGCDTAHFGLMQVLEEIERRVSAT